MSYGGAHAPIIPKASKEELGSLESVEVAWSRGTEVTVASPYLTLTGDVGVRAGCPLVASGWIIRPSTAAQTKSFRTRPGILIKITILCSWIDRPAGVDNHDTTSKLGLWVYEWLRG